MSFKAFILAINNNILSYDLVFSDLYSADKNNIYDLATEYPSIIYSYYPDLINPL